MSSRILSGTVVAIILVVAPAVGTPTPLVVWNASPSVPIGFYRVGRVSPRTGDVALIRLPPHVAWFAARRAYLPQDAYLLKPVVAVAGQQVCRLGMRTFIRGQFAALAQLSDKRGRPLPTWKGCRVLRAGEAFLLADDPDSFDSRYFGPISRQHIIGPTFLIW